jgi:hypothetical protein
MAFRQPDVANHSAGQDCEDRLLLEYRHPAYPHWFEILWVDLGRSGSEEPNPNALQQMTLEHAVLKV